VKFTLDGKEYAFEADYPKDFATLLKQLEKFDS
jgi:23S rRNA pseudouridine955/2504/2580 synthase